MPSSIFSPELFLRPALKEYLARAVSIPSGRVDMLVEAIRHPSRLGQLESIEGIARLIPTGLFDNHMIESFLAKVSLARREGQ
jgi:NTE family protein